jgi:hypothetical protein
MKTGAVVLKFHAMSSVQTDLLFAHLRRSSLKKQMPEPVGPGTSLQTCFAVTCALSAPFPSA